MNITLDIDYNAIDALFLQILYDGYEATYHCHEEDVRKYLEDPKRWTHIREDLYNNKKVLDAYETLAKHFSVGTEAEKRLRAIRDRVDYKYKIAKGMAQFNG